MTWLVIGVGFSVGLAAYQLLITGWVRHAERKRVRSALDFWKVH